MRIFRYLIRETFKAQLAVFVVLMTIFISQQFVSVLTEASEGQVPATLILQVLGLQLPALAALILPISLFLGILMAHGRIYADNEMAVLHACGVSEWYVTRATLAFATVLAAITAVLTIWLGPWAMSQEHQIAERARMEAGLTAVQTGRFQQASSQNAVIFIEQQAEGGRLEGVFVAQLPERSEVRGERASVVMAQYGQVSSDGSGGQTLILENGRRYSQHVTELDHQVMEFSRYQMQIREQEIDQERRRLESIPTLELMQRSDYEAQAELQWRIAIPLAMPLLTLIAVPLARVNPRQGKFARMGPALMIYLGYFLVLMAAKRALGDGAIPVSVGLWWIHVALAIFGFILVFKGRPMGHKALAKLRGRG
ncbi:LPS export ABC transporter permease LptF [Aliidiomarina maris]|uniref:Lipopolysaccharide export system permease protein LptF n=1 Tax=Aliidiomarina maris TaxID=531312 RepID=A0A327WT27_9GAMM|nr:LPS export ABC transporter permease LptF [Aliidiomarina maris]MBA3988588.1 LPS export ABC transporter permease LptF [Idiomarina sp.]RAJ95267.1 lipopolysaccharide export system permease protein [Aliidiomarina maris]RUO21036.1 LPS export ABC transporter permease LptF [Aliidiomarina maris]